MFLLETAVALAELSGQGSRSAGEFPARHLANACTAGSGHVEILSQSPESVDCKNLERVKFDD